MENKPLYIPPSKKWKGLTIYCKRCMTNVSETCKETGKPLNKCQFGDRHVFKVYIHVPNTENSRKTKTLETRDVNEAIKQAIEFEKEVKGSDFFEKSKMEKVEVKKEIRKVIKEDNTKPQLLVHSLARYVGFLNNEGTPAHRKKERSKDHIKDVERAFTALVQCLTNNGHDISTFKVDEINDNFVGEVYSYLDDKKFANRTFNKYLSHYTSFLKWYGEEYNSPIRNWFERINRRMVHHDPQSITKEEYEALLKQILPENGIREYENGVKHIRNYYRPWLADGFRLALETGRRREEVIKLKFSEIITDNNGIPNSIKIEDFKVNRIQNRKDESSKSYIYIPVTDSLYELLLKLGYEQNKNTDKYILAPDIEISRKKVMADVLSRGFSHYYSQLNTGRELTFKSLRKTYITNLAIHLRGGGDVKTYSGHSDDAVIEKHYLDKKAIAKSLQNFKVFSNEPERNEELEKVRKIENNKTKNIER